MSSSIVQFAQENGIHAGAELDVLLGDTGGPMIRTLRQVRATRQYGKEWLLIEWDPQGLTPWGTADCGSSGWEVSDKLRQAITAYAAKSDAQVSGSAPGV